jgi:hypothetical protein
MRLTKRQRALLKEAKAIAHLTNLDFHLIENEDIDRTLALTIAIHKMVIAEVVIRYTFLDEVLADIIAKYYFNQAKTRIDFVKLWHTKKFRTFVHHVLDEMYLLKKMELVHAIEPFPSNVTNIIRKINAVRNAFAHSLFPENRREHRKNKKVLYGDKDIRTHEGLKKFLKHWQPTFNYLAERFDR